MQAWTKIKIQPNRRWQGYDFGDRSPPITLEIVDGTRPLPPQVRRKLIKPRKPVR